MEKYLVQYVCDCDGEVVITLMSANEIIKYDNESDIYGIHSMRVWQITNNAEVIPLSSAGWQPNCEITWYDANGNIIIHGYGEDH